MQILYFITAVLLSVYSWGFVDANSPLPHISMLYDFVHKNRSFAAYAYAILFAGLFGLYLMTLKEVKKGRLSIRKLIQTIGIVCIVLFLGFPGFSYDVFNYMATAKITYLYQENPYVVMPIEIPNESMLVYMHAANKIALYGPSWILMTLVPHIAGFGNSLMTIYMFKIMVILFYIGTLWLIWRLSGKNLFAVAFFGLNPLVVTETVLSGHNDIVMMFFVLSAFYLLQKKRYIWATTALISSILIKYATLVLVPIFIFVMIKTMKKEKIAWKTVWWWSTLAMYAAFLLSPLRVEIYSWYFIWPLTFAALLDSRSILVFLSYGFTFGLPYRFLPFIYTREWGGITPMAKKISTFIPPMISGLYGYLKNR